MKKVEIYISFILLSLAFVILLATLYPYRRPDLPKNIVNKIPTITPIPSISPVVILSPNLTLPLKSPQKIIGLVNRSWVFEAAFPIELFSAKNKSLYQGSASVPNWSEGSDKFIQFSAILNFSTPEKTGYLKINNDNPSGLPQNDKSIQIPVIFSQK
jgi:hypothetical protein